jgi:hypothetical protein
MSKTSIIEVIFFEKKKEIFCLIDVIFNEQNKETFERNKEIFSLIDGAEQGNISYINSSIYYSIPSIERLVENIYSLTRSD